MEQFLVDAEALARLLGDEYSTEQLNRLRVSTQMTIEELKRNKDLLESNLSLKLRKIAAQRAELYRLQGLAVEETLNEDRQYQRLAGRNLNQAVAYADSVQQSQESLK